MDELLQVNQLKKYFKTPGGMLHAVDGVSLTIDRGKTLGVVAETCDKVAIMYAGEIVEYGSLEDIFDRMAHPYTKGLFDSLPSLDRVDHRLKPIRGLMPDPTDLPEGCSFQPRCPYATEQCKGEAPVLEEIGPGHHCRCHHVSKGGENDG